MTLISYLHRLMEMDHRTVEKVLEVRRHFHPDSFDLSSYHWYNRREGEVQVSVVNRYIVEKLYQTLLIPEVNLCVETVNGMGQVPLATDPAEVHVTKRLRIEEKFPSDRKVIRNIFTGTLFRLADRYPNDVPEMLTREVTADSQDLLRDRYMELRTDKHGQLRCSLIDLLNGWLRSEGMEPTSFFDTPDNIALDVPIQGATANNGRSPDDYDPFADE